MRGQLIGLGVAMLMFGIGLPALAYHIDNSEPPGTAPGPSSNDFILGSDLIICEREWGDGSPVNAWPGGNVPADDRNDNPQKTPPGTHYGDGGLCTTGENDASGRLPPGQGTVFPCGAACWDPANSPSSAAQLNNEGFTNPANTYTRLDACNVLTIDRNGGGAAYGAYPLMAGGLAPQYVASSSAGPCAAAVPVPGDTNDHAYTAEMGTFSCFIPTSTVLTPLSNYAFYFDRQYAWFAYDGDGWYTSGNSGGKDHGTAETVLLDGEADSTPNNNLGMIVTPGFDNEDAFHGHAAMFISPADGPPDASPLGSAETSPASAGMAVYDPDGAGPLLAGPVWATNPLGPNSDCGSAQGFTTGGVAGGLATPYGCHIAQPCGSSPLGPVFRACYLAAVVGTSVTCAD